MPPVLGPDPQLPYDFSGLGSQLCLNFPLLGPGPRLIFDASRAQLPLEKVDDFSGFRRWKVVK